MYKNKKSGIIGIVITVIILILIVIFSNGDQNSNFLQNISSMQIKNSDRTVNISLFPVDSYRFAEIDNYTVEIKFNNNLTNLNYIFQDCTSLTEVDFSHFIIPF